MVYFNSDKHLYTSDTGDNYISVTTLLKKLEQPRDWDAIATKYAKKHGETAQYWRDLWKAKGDISAERGTAVHSIFENKFYTEPQEYNVYQHEETVNSKSSMSLKDLKEGIYPELLIYSHRFKIAGQSDLVKIYPDKTFEIEDYKTDKVINFGATKYYNAKKKMSVKSMYCYPVTHLDECNWNKYQLQLSIYAYLLEQFGFKCKSLQINHVIAERDDNGIIELDETGIPKIIEVQKHKCAYLKKEAEQILKTLTY